MLKIAYILDFFPVFSETFILREILELRRRGFKVRIMARLNSTAPEKLNKVIHREAEKLIDDVYYFSQVDAEMPKYLKALNHLYIFLIHPVRYLRTLSYSRRTNRETFWCFKQSVLHAVKMEREGIDHIHAHFAVEACKYAMLISMITGIPYSFTIHAHDIFIRKNADLIEDKFRHAKFTACISQFNKAYISSHYPGVRLNNTKIIHCGVDLSNLHQLNGKANPVFNVTAVGRLVEHKGFKPLINACKALKQRGLNFDCNIIGEGDQRRELEELIRSLDLSDVVHLRGAMEQNEVLRAISSADLFVLPCVVEKNGMQDGIPVALMEAMALQVPVVSTKVSGVPELIRDGAGLLVEPENVNALADAIEAVYRLSDQERKEMGTKGRVIIEQEFNLTREVQKLAELFIQR
jgi:glycosyltransferase involved in cell wall biosynthesis